MTIRLWLLAIFCPLALCSFRVKRQQTDDQFYFMNRGMLMIGQGLTELLTNQKYDSQQNAYFSGIMEPHDPNDKIQSKQINWDQINSQQEQWYKEYYGKHGRRLYFK